MEISDADGDVVTVDRNLDSILEETVEEVMIEAGNPVEKVEEVVEERAGTSGDVDSPRASVPPTKKDKLIRKKRKRSSSEDSSLPEPNPDDEAGPLSNVNKEINIGDDFQAIIEEFTDRDRKAYLAESDSEEILIWDAPDETMDMEKLTKWAKEASERFLMPMDRVLFILRTKHFNYDEAYKLISTRPEIDEEWEEEETHIFDRCFSNFGKNFPSIHGGLRHRSVRSIVKHYYASKKWIKYKQFASSKLNDCKLDNFKGAFPDSMFESMCEHCGEKVDHLEHVHHFNRLWCRACIIYFKMTGAIRPVPTLLTLYERKDWSTLCPEVYRGYMKDFDRMMTPATGETFRRRRMGKDQIVEDIVGNLEYQSPPLSRKWRERIRVDANGTYFQSLTAGTSGRQSSESPIPIRENEASSNQNGIATTNGSHEDSTNPESEISSNGLEPTASSSNGNETNQKNGVVDQIPTSSAAASNAPKVNVWLRKKTLCMEEIEVLANDARRKMYDACQYGSRVSIRNVERMKADMSSLRMRMEQDKSDLDLTPSFLASKEIGSATTEWAEHHKDEALKCFKWYGPKFQEISQILGHKSMQQIRDFYYSNRELINAAIADFEKEMNDKVKVHEESVKAKAQKSS